MNMYCCLGRREMLKIEANIPSNNISRSLSHLMFTTKHRIYYGRNGNMVQRRAKPNYFSLKEKNCRNSYFSFQKYFLHCEEI